MADFIDEPFEVEIKMGIAMLSWPSGLRRAMPLTVFRIESAGAVKALAEYDARCAEVILFKAK